MASENDLQQLLSGTGVGLAPRSDNRPVWAMLAIAHVLILIEFVSFFFVIS